MRKLLFALIFMSAALVVFSQPRVQGVPRFDLTADYEDPEPPKNENHTFSFDDIKNWNGDGTNRAAVVIQWNDARETHATVFGYRWNGNATTADMLTAIAKENPQFYWLIMPGSDYGTTIGGMGWDADGDGDITLLLNGATLSPKDGTFTTTSYDDYDTAQAGDTDDWWQSGWMDRGYWYFYTRPTASANFIYAQSGISSHSLSDGVWVGFTFGPVPGAGQPADWKEWQSAPSASQSEFYVDGIYYRLINSVTKTVEVSAPFSYEGAAPVAYTGDVTIPESFTFGAETYTVAYIGQDAFSGSAITSVNILAPVNLISEQAFKDCTALREVTLPESVTTFAASAFEGCAALQPFTIHEGVTLISEAAFAGTSWTELYLPSTLTEIKSRAFADNAAITSVTSLSNTPPRLADDAFDSAVYSNATLYVKATARNNYYYAAGWEKFDKLEEASIASEVGDSFVSNGVNYIITSVSPAEVSVAPLPNSANYTGDIVVPASVTLATTNYAVTGIADKAFNAARTNLKSVSLPDGIRTIGEMAFANTYLNELNLTDNLESIGTRAFYSTHNLKSIYIGDKVKELPTGAFEYAYDLTELRLPASLTTIGESAFASSGLTKLDIPSSVTSIGANAFRSTKIEEIILPPNLSVLSESMFSAASARRIVLPSHIKVIPQNCFYNAKVEELNLPEGLQEIGKQAFYGCDRLMLTSLPSTVTKIGEWGFYKCALLHITSLPEGLTEVAKMAFASCTNLDSLYIPDAVKTIGSSAFGPSGLKRISGMKNVTTIYDQAFANFEGTEATLPSSLSRIYNSGNANTYGLFFAAPAGFRLWVCPVTPPYIPTNYTTAFARIYRNAVEKTDDYARLYVPFGTAAAYEKATGWSKCVIEELTPEVTFDMAATDLQSNAAKLCVTPRFDYTDPELQPSEEFIAVNNSCYLDAFDYSLQWGYFKDIVLGTITDVTVENGTISGDATKLGTNRVHYFRLKMDRKVAEGEEAAEPQYSPWFEFYTAPTAPVKPGSVLDGHPLTYKVLSLDPPTVAVTHRPLATDSKGNVTGTIAQANAVDYAGDIVIPSRVNLYNVDYDVVAITDSAFFYSAITNVTIPETVKTIGTRAFARLTRPVKQIVIPETVEETGSALFDRSALLESAILPSHITTVPEYTFNGVTALKEYTIPEGVTSIGAYAFSGTSLSDINLSDELTSIGESAFEGCSGLTITALPAHLTMAGRRAFYGCTITGELILPPSLTSIGVQAFTAKDNDFHLYVMSEQVPDLADEGLMMTPSLGNFPGGFATFAPVTVLYGLQEAFDAHPGWHRSAINTIEPVVTFTSAQVQPSPYEAVATVGFTCVNPDDASAPAEFLALNLEYFSQTCPLQAELRLSGQEDTKTFNASRQGDEWQVVFTGLDDDADYEYRFSAGQNHTEWSTFHTPEYVWVSPDYSDGWFILNEDWFGHDNGSINFYSTKDNKMYYRVFREENNGKTLGVTSQFAQIYADKMFIMSKQAASGNGGRLVVADATTMKELASIDEIGGDGRAFAGVSPEKGYLGTSSGIYPLNLTDYTVGELISGTQSEGNVYSGQIGEMVRMGDYLYAAAQNTGVLVIDIESDAVVRTIDLPSVITIFATADGQLYAANKDDEAEFVRIDTTDFSTEAINVQHESDNVKMTDSWGSWRRGMYAVAADGNAIYYAVSSYGTRILRYDFDTATLDYDFLILPEAENSKGQMSGMTLYGSGIALDPVTDKLILTTTGASFKFNSNWMLTADPATGEVEKICLLDDYYWFPAMTLFPDNAEPEWTDELPALLTFDILDNLIPEAEQFDLNGMAADDDHPSWQIRYSLSAEDENIATVTRTAQGKYEVEAAGNAGTSNLIFRAESNGKVAEKVIPVTVTTSTGLRAITYGEGISYANGELRVPDGARIFNVQGFEVQPGRVEPGIYLIHLLTGKTVKVIAK